MMAFPEFDGLFKNLVNHVAISLGTCPITSNWSIKLFGCNVCLAAIFSGFWTWSGISVFSFAAWTTATAFESFMLFRFRFSKYSSSTFGSQSSMYDIPWWKTSSSARLVLLLPFYVLFFSIHVIVAVTFNRVGDFLSAFMYKLYTTSLTVI